MLSWNMEIKVKDFLFLTLEPEPKLYNGYYQLQPKVPALFRLHI
jgi:hypothetical protein